MELGQAFLNIILFRPISVIQPVLLFPVHPNNTFIKTASRENLGT